MKRMLGRLCAVLLFVLIFSLQKTVQAEQIIHHGVEVNYRGSASDCLACHDGGLARPVATCTVTCGYKTAHSLLKDYPPVKKRKKFVPAAVVKAKGIKFENGKVTCISCHNLKNPKRYHLVMENKKSRLCLACHIE